MTSKVSNWLDSMPTFWVILIGSLLALFWALASGVPLGGWMLAFLITVFMGRLVASLLGNIGLALYAVLVCVAFVSFIAS